MDLLAALTLGLLGSMHCIGMCGPLMLAVPSSAKAKWKFVVERIVYNVGRTITYGVLGVVLGLVGKSLLVSIQQDVSIALGIIVLFTVVIPFGLKSKVEKYSPLKFIYNFIKEKFSIFLRRKGFTALFILGVLNGLLPCGLVYTALIGALAVADAFQSALLMMIFGMGTIPALVAVAATGKLLSVKFRSLLTRSIPLFSITLALLLILRGLNLGIPLVSPKVTHTVIHQETKTQIDCCE